MDATLPENFPAKDPGPTSVSASPTEVGRRIGPYEIVEKIAEGGMGAVYVAQQHEPIRRRVALKVIKTGRDSQQIVTRFEAERQALAMMDHPNIARIFDGGTTSDGSPFFVMELVDGVPLTEHCDRNKLSIRERLELFIPVCNAVQHAHTKGIAHRDLKPSNVLVAVHDGVPTAKVIDFGLAKATDHQTKLTDKTMFTEFGRIVGTLQYMSPEQAELNPAGVDTRTDVYSLGVMLYELLTGSTPLERDTMHQVAVAKVLEVIRDSDPPRPSKRIDDTSDTISKISDDRQIEVTQLRSMLRGELDWVVMKALEKDRERRYVSAGSFAEDVTRFLSDQTVHARPPSVAYRARKFIKRNRLKVVTAMSVASIAIVLAVLIPTIWSSKRDTTIARLEKDLGSHLAAMSLDEEDWTEANALIEQLRVLDKAPALLARERLVDSILTRADRIVQRPRLPVDQRDAVTAALLRFGAVRATL